MTRTTYALCLIGAIATMMAGCGSGGDSSSVSATGDSGSGGKQVSNPEDIAIAVVSAEKVGDLGKVLVDAEGRTLYDFHKDKRTLYSAKSSACYGACAEAWPPLLTGGEPEAEKGASPTKLSTLKRKDGTLQVTYYGHPLYTYVEDEKPGEANGNDVKAFGGEWYALEPGGEEPKQEAAKAKKGAWGVVFGAEGSLGIILYDLSGHTLYTFSSDKGGTSSCYGACAKRWPPALTEGKPEGRGEVQAALVGASKRKDGTRQLTYAGHPLYTFSGDGGADANGNGVTAFGGEWYAIRPNGEKP